MENPTKEEREKLHEQEKLDLINKEKSRKTRKKILFSVILVIIAGGFTYYGVYTSTQPGKYDDFAKCLTEKGAVIYGNDYCSYTIKQMGFFGKSKEYLDYVKCKILFFIFRLFLRITIFYNFFLYEGNFGLFF